MPTGDVSPFTGRRNGRLVSNDFQSNLKTIGQTILSAIIVFLRRLLLYLQCKQRALIVYSRQFVTPSLPATQSDLSFLLVRPLLADYKSQSRDWFGFIECACELCALYLCACWSRWFNQKFARAAVDSMTAPALLEHLHVDLTKRQLALLNELTCKFNSLFQLMAFRSSTRRQKKEEEKFKI